MEGYRVELAERTNLESRENSFALKLKTWCKMVKSEVLSPTTQEDANNSRPRSNNHTSDPIEKARALAASLDIVDFPDVGLVINSIKVFAWCLHLLEVLMRKPAVEEVRYLLALCDGNSLKIPESKCIRMLRSMSSRAQLWQSKAKKALAADSKAEKPYDLILLKELLLTAKQIPLTMPEEARLWNTIEDRGSRHCICGGPSDGSFMLCCDSCDNWYHGVCMKLDQATSDALAKWICPHCSGKSPSKPVQVNGVDPSTNGAPLPKIALNPLVNISPHAPNPVELWPPFGLRDSSSSTEALGKMGDSDNEDFDFSRKPAAKPAAPAKEDVSSKTPKSNVVLASKIDKATLSPKQPGKITVQKLLAMKIPAAHQASKGFAVNAGSNTANVSSLKKAAVISNVTKIAPKSSHGMVSQYSSAAIKMPKPSAALSLSKHTGASTAPKVVTKTVITSSSAVQKQSVKNSTSYTKHPSNTAVPSNKDLHSAGVPVVTSSSKNHVKTSQAKPSFAVASTTKQASATMLHAAAIPGAIANNQAKTSLVLPRDAVPAKLIASPSSSPIKYPKPENGVTKAINGTDTNAAANATVAVKAATATAKELSLPPDYISNDANNASTSNSEI